VSVLDHADWAAGIAGQVARRYRLRGQEREELVAHAHLTVCRVLDSGRFDPTEGLRNNDVAGAFRGWAYPTVLCECSREAQRLRGGGLFHTIRPEHLFAVADLGDHGGDLADGGWLPDPPAATVSGLTDDTQVSGRAIADPPAPVGPPKPITGTMPPPNPPPPDPARGCGILGRVAARPRPVAGPAVPLVRGTGVCAVCRRELPAGAEFKTCSRACGAKLRASNDAAKAGEYRDVPDLGECGDPGFLLRFRAVAAAGDAGALLDRLRKVAAGVAG
jgi:hypothetical protein